jgi:hypothetical protein
MAELNIAGLYFFMPIFSFLFVFLIVYAILLKTKLLGEGKFVIALVSFVIAIIFMSFSTANFSTDQYIRTIVPWFAVLLVCVFLVLLLAGLSTKDLGKIMTSKFAWVVIAILIVIFIIAAIRVFNPVFNWDYGVSSGDHPQVISQIGGLFSNAIGGGILLLIIAIIVAWVITRK